MNVFSIRQKVGIPAIVFFLSIVVLGIAQATISVIQSLPWTTPTVISIDNRNGNGPDLMMAPNGDMMIVYSQWTANLIDFSNPYFSESVNSGQSWSAPQSVLSTPNNTSQVFVSGTYDSASTAHVVWVELSPGGQGVPPHPVFSIPVARVVIGQRRPKSQHLF